MISEQKTKSFSDYTIDELRSLSFSRVFSLFFREITSDIKKSKDSSQKSTKKKYTLPFLNIQEFIKRVIGSRSAPEKVTEISSSERVRAVTEKKKTKKKNGKSGKKSAKKTRDAAGKSNGSFAIKSSKNEPMIVTHIR